ERCPCSSAPGITCPGWSCWASRSSSSDGCAASSSPERHGPMPYPRFHRLAEARRAQMLDTAAPELAAPGLAEAYINRILERAGMSKGAAYYYFEDKVDLFLTVVEYCSERLQLIDHTVDPARLDAATFWPTFADLHRQPLLRSYDRPW